MVKDRSNSSNLTTLYLPLTIHAQTLHANILLLSIERKHISDVRVDRCKLIKRSGIV